MVEKIVSILRLVPVILISSCATTGYQRASEARSAINDARVVTASVQQKLDVAGQALESLTTNEVTNLLPAYQRFAAAVESLGVEVERLAHSALAVEKRNNAYVSRWQSILSGYGNADVRRSSAERLGRVSEAFRQLKSEFRTAEEALRPLLVSLKDMRLYLGTDLTASGVASVQDHPRISTQVAEAQQALQTLQADLTKVADQLSSVRSPTPGESAEMK